MGFLTKEGLQNLTNKLVQGDAIKVASHRGKNVKEVIYNIQRECENVALPNTMTLENRVNEFKVGQGRDVDVSGDVEESKIELKLQGKTYQNLCKSKCDFKAQYPSNFNTQIYDDKVVVTRINENDSGWAYYCNNTLKAKMLKPSTVYTLFFKYETNFTNVPRVQFIQGNALQHLSDHYDATKIKDNIYMCKITTISSFDDKEIGSQVLYFYNSPRKTGDKITLYKHMVLLEGDYSETPIDEIPKYFEGIKSSFEDGVVDVEVQGKNLWNNDNIYEASYTSWIPRIDLDNAQKITGYQYVATNTLRGIATIIKVKPNTYYTVNIPSIKTDNKIAIAFYEEIEQINKPSTHCIKHYPNIGSSSYTFNTPQIECYMVIGLFGDYTPLQNGNVLVEGFRNMQVTQLKIVTSYEPYYKKKISFNIGEPLRSLPNGVCDEIRNNNGQWELIRRVGKVILNGSEPWLIASGNNNNTMYWNVDNIGNAKTYVSPEIIPNLICDKISITSYNTAFNMDKDSTMMCLTNRGKSTTNSIAIRMLNPNNHAGVLSEWLSQNPTTVYYELKTPIITPIEPIEFDISQGAVININSDISPTSTHKVILNRAGQIEQGIELIADLKSRINELENIYDSNLIATQYRIDNLKLNYELEREED